MLDRRTFKSCLDKDKHVTALKSTGQSQLLQRRAGDSKDITVCTCNDDEKCPDGPRRHTNGLVFVVLAVLLNAAGCNQASMTSYFAAADLDDKEPVLKFYRVKVTGESRLSRTNLQTGFYDASALQSLFGMVKPNEAVTRKRIPNDPANVVLEVNPVTGRVRQVEQNQRFTILYGSNADAIASQISAFSQSRTTGQAMARIIGAAAGQDAYTGLISAQGNAKQAEKANEAAQKALTDAANGIKPDDDATARKRKLIQAVIASLQAAGVIFDAPAVNEQSMDAELNDAIRVLKGVLEGMKNGSGS